MMLNIENMSLREKIGQIGMPSPRAVREGVYKWGSYIQYFKKYPFAGMYIKDHDSITNDSGEKIRSPEELFQLIKKVNENVNIPIFVTCDAELGGIELFSGLHRVASLMSLGAAKSKKLAFERSCLYAKELKSCGINWIFGPVCDLLPNFFSPSGIRCISDKAERVAELIPEIIRGIQNVGMAATAKHYPGEYGDYRDPHFSPSINRMTMEQWNTNYRKIWQSAVDAGVLSIMVQHTAFPAVDNSFIRGKNMRPASASYKIIDILRKELRFEGVIITDAVSMKSMASAFEREDIYVECFNAGNDIVLFCDDDYIDIMEKAVLSGRIMMERLDASVKRVLKMKEILGLFQPKQMQEPLTFAENKLFAKVNYEVGKSAMTLLNDINKKLPLDIKKIRRVTIICLSPHKPFKEDLKAMQLALEEREVKVNIVETLKSKEELARLSEEEDLLIYACFLAQGMPQGMSFYSRPEEMSTLFHGLSFGADKSIVVSFGAPSVYHNYFETADIYINAYSSDSGTMQAFVDGIFGEYSFTGESPVALHP